MSFMHQAALARFMAMRGASPRQPPVGPAAMRIRPPPATGNAQRTTLIPLARRRALNPALAALRGSADILAPAMRALQRQVRVSRGKSIEAERAAARAQINGLSLKQHAEAIRTRLRNAALSKPRVSALSQYTAFMASKGLDPILPITFQEAAPFLSWKVLDRNNLSHNLKSILSNLRRAATSIGQWAVTESDEDSLNALINDLRATVPSSARVTTPVDAPTLAATAAALRREGTLLAEQTRAIILVAPATLARGTETSGVELGMRWGDFLLDSRGLGFSAHFSKKGKLSADPRPRAFPHPPEQWAELCPVKCLSEFRTLWRDSGGKVSPESPIWCAVEAGRPSARPLTVAQIMASCRRALLAHGAPHDSLHAHWPRHTGSSLLTAHYGVESSAADLLGDWSPSEEGGNVAAAKSTRKKVYENPSLPTLMNLAVSATGGPRRLLCCPALSRHHSH
jgi:hypothetical protein